MTDKQTASANQIEAIPPGAPRLLDRLLQHHLADDGVWSCLCHRSC